MENEPGIAETTRQAVKRARWRYVEPPILAFLLMTLIPLITVPFYGVGPYREYMPDIVFIAGIGVIFIGAWYDFGASAYVKELKDFYRKTPSDEDLIYIQKQQLILTLLYILIGFLYFTAAIVIYLFL